VRVLSERQYQSLAPQDQDDYVRSLRQAVLDFELSQEVRLSRSETQTSTNFVLLEALLPFSYALDSSFCPVGGVARSTAPDSSGQPVCPTTGRNCGGKQDGFRCGQIFSGVCVDREPVGDLSERCYNDSKAKSERMTAAQFNQFRADVKEIDDKVCAPKNPTPESPCGFFRKRLTELGKRFYPSTDAAAAAQAPAPAANGQPATQAPDPAEAVVEKPGRNASTAQGVQELASVRKPTNKANLNDKFYYCRAFMEQGNIRDMRQFARAFDLTQDGIQPLKPLPKGMVQSPATSSKDSKAYTFEIGVPKVDRSITNINVEDQGGDPRTFALKHTSTTDTQLEGPKEWPKSITYDLQFTMRNGHCLPLNATRTQNNVVTTVFDFDTCLKAPQEKKPLPLNMNCEFMRDFKEAVKDTRFNHSATGPTSTMKQAAPAGAAR
jgi:hypothetical protein